MHDDPSIFRELMEHPGWKYLQEYFRAVDHKIDPRESIEDVAKRAMLTQGHMEVFNMAESLATHVEKPQDEMIPFAHYGDALDDDTAAKQEVASLLDKHNN